MPKLKVFQESDFSYFKEVTSGVLIHSPPEPS